jgi:hypothetical protein
MKIARLIAIAITAIVALVVALAACGTAHIANAPARKAPATSTSAPVQAAPVAAPVAPSADATLTADGYTTVIDVSSAQITANFGAAAPYVTSAAGGTNGGTIEVVAVIDPAGVQLAGGIAPLAAKLPGPTPAGR